MFTKQKFYDVQEELDMLDSPLACWLVNVRHSKNKTTLATVSWETSNLQHLVCRLQTDNDNGCEWTHLLSNTTCASADGMRTRYKWNICTSNCRTPNTNTRITVWRHVISMGIGPAECAVARLEINTKQIKPNLSNAYPSTCGMPTKQNCSVFGKAFNHVLNGCLQSQIPSWCVSSITFF